MNLIITTPEELELAIIKAVKKALSFEPEASYTINQVSKMLKKSHKTVTKMVDQKIIITTADGLITKTAINQYLSKE